MPPKVDVRRLLKKQQAERTKASKVDHPFAKYDEAGRLFCVVCNAMVKSESVWQAHLGSQVHRDNIQKLKELKQKQQQLKRPAPPNVKEQNKRIRIEEDKQDIELSEEDASSDEEEEQDKDMGLPADFFDDTPAEIEPVEEVAEESNASSGLPSGFFDDPDEEAKVQGSLNPAEQAKLNLEKDLEEFNEAMADATKDSREVQEEDDELFWQERHYEINREQAEFDSRVEKLKKLRQSGGVEMTFNKRDQKENVDDTMKVDFKSTVRQLLKSKTPKLQESMFDDDEMEDSEEEDWRALQL